MASMPMAPSSEHPRRWRGAVVPHFRIRSQSRIRFRSLNQGDPMRLHCWCCRSPGSCRPGNEIPPGQVWECRTCRWADRCTHQRVPAAEECPAVRLARPSSGGCWHPEGCGLLVPAWQQGSKISAALSYPVNLGMDTDNRVLEAIILCARPRPYPFACVSETDSTAAVRVTPNFPADAAKTECGFVHMMCYLIGRPNRKRCAPGATSLVGLGAEHSVFTF